VSVRLNGRVFEALAAAGRRPRRDLYHSALVVTVPGASYVVEMTPVRLGDRAARGVVAEGPVGMRWLGRWRLFRYEVHRWRDGVIPDLSYAVGSPVRCGGEAVARRVLDLAASVPAPVWGRDELGGGEMWNSNSITAWLLALAGADVGAIPFPPNSRAPGWDAGLEVARQGTPLREATPAAVDSP
jgi:hypothetical protein